MPNTPTKTEAEMDAALLLSKAKLEIMFKYPFFSNLLLGMKTVLTNDAEIKTMATNGKELFVNYDFVNTKSKKELVFILLHEIAHVILLHHVRYPVDANNMLWNYACDYAVNGLLVSYHKLDKTDDCVFNVEYENKTTEQIYSILKKKYPESIKQKYYIEAQEEEGENNECRNDGTDDGDSDGDGDNDGDNVRNNIVSDDSCNPGDSADGGEENQENSNQNETSGCEVSAEGHQEKESNQTDSKSEDGKSKEQRDSELEQIAKIVEASGMVIKSKDSKQSEERRLNVDMILAKKLSGQKGSGLNRNETEKFLDKMVSDICTTDISWKSVLHDFFNNYSKSDWNFLVPNRRFSGSNVIMPSLHSYDSLDFVIAIDTSPSIDQEALKVFINESKKILADIEYEKVVIIYCSDSVHKVDFFTKNEEIVLDPAFGDGTAFSPVFERIKELDIQPACIVYFTDMECCDFGANPGVPVLWCKIKMWDGGSYDVFDEDYTGLNKQKLPFGKILNLNIDNIR